MQETPKVVPSNMYRPLTVTLCRHCTHGTPFGAAIRCNLNGMVSHFGCSQFLREPGADDEL